VLSHAVEPDKEIAMSQMVLSVGPQHQKDYLESWNGDVPRDIIGAIKIL